MNHLTVFLITMLSIFSACKKKDKPVDKCINGFLDIGENGVDCGGNCPPCVPSEPASVYLECNGSALVMPNKTLTYQNNSWSLNVSNDSLSVQVNLGSNGSIGTYAMNPIGSLGSLNSTFYLNASNGVYSFTAHNLVTHKLSGFFQVDLSRNGFTDTLHIRNGQFQFLPY